jgi:hypothetical protein
MTAPEALCAGIAQCAQSILENQLAGLYQHGSVVLGDFHPGISDIDLLGVVSGPVDEERLKELEAGIAALAPQLPVAGVEFILCTAETVAIPAANPPFVFALSAGRDWPAERESAGTSPDLPILFALCRQAGVALAGRPPREVFGQVPRTVLAGALLSEMAWHRVHALNVEHDAWGAQAVLNAARSIHAAETGVIVSKAEGARRWLARYPNDPLVADALALRLGANKEPMHREKVLAFVDLAIAAIET